MSHTLSVPSREAEKSLSPAGENSSLIGLTCPGVILVKTAWSDIRVSWTVPSSSAQASTSPSGERATTGPFKFDVELMNCSCCMVCRLNCCTPASVLTSRLKLSGRKAKGSTKVAKHGTPSAGVFVGRGGGVNVAVAGKAGVSVSVGWSVSVGVGETATWVGLQAVTRKRTKDQSTTFFGCMLRLMRIDYFPFTRYPITLVVDFSGSTCLVLPAHDQHMLAYPHHRWVGAGLEVRIQPDLVKFFVLSQLVQLPVMGRADAF